MCKLFPNLHMLLTLGPHTVYDGDPIYILHLYDPMWLVGYIYECTSHYNSVTTVILINNLFTVNLVYVTGFKD